jgi:hypothetical protein
MAHPGWCRCKTRKYDGVLPERFARWRGKTWEEVLVMFFWDKCCCGAKDISENIFVALFDQVAPNLATIHPNP